MVTVAPGIASPCASTMRPEMEPVVSCAPAAGMRGTIMQATRRMKAVAGFTIGFLRQAKLQFRRQAGQCAFPRGVRLRTASALVAIACVARLAYNRPLDANPAVRSLRYRRVP